MIELIGYLLSICIGLTLGLIGGGGSILTVPILVYCFRLDAITATAYSLFIVGVTSVFGTISGFKKNLIDIKTALWFAPPSLITVYCVRKYAMPILPSRIEFTANLALDKDGYILLLFAVIMLFAALKMIKSKPTSENVKPKKVIYPVIIIEGVIVGALTGFIGAGGGFLIIPALVLFMNTPMKTAIYTSLLIISVKSLIGFTGDIQNLSIDWTFLLTVTGLAISGIFMGVYLSKYIAGKQLKKAFGWFVLIMSSLMIMGEII